MNTAAFRRGNGFESRIFGGRHWRGRNGRFRSFWAGGIFWPFLFGDYFSYAFWPTDYYSPFWEYGPGSILWGALWPYDGYGGFYAGDPYGPGGGVYQGETFLGYGGRHVLRRGRAAAFGAGQMSALCSGFAPGVTDLPLAELERIIEPNPEQKAALTELREAVAKASEILRTACPKQAPANPAARLDAMEQRLAAMQQAMSMTSGPLQRLYDLLSGPQIARLENATAKAAERQRPPSLNIAQLCSAESGLTDAHSDEIAQVIHLSEEQQFELDQLKKASAKAAENLRASCPANAPQSLKGRLELAQKRIAALIEAIAIVRPAVGAFYDSLSDQQKQALNSKVQRSQAAQR